MFIYCAYLFCILYCCLQNNKYLENVKYFFTCKKQSWEKRLDLSKKKKKHRAKRSQITKNAELPKLHLTWLIWLLWSNLQNQNCFILTNDNVVDNGLDLPPGVMVSSGRKLQMGDTLNIKNKLKTRDPQSSQGNDKCTGNTSWLFLFLTNNGSLVLARNK